MKEKTEGLVIRKVDFSETSRIVTLFTRDFGKVSALAKGGRRLKGPFESALDLLAVCRVVFIRKSSSSLDLLTEARLVKAFRPVGRDLFSFYGGYYVAELLHALTEEYDPHPQLYDTAVQTLEVLCQGKASRLAVVRFELVLLQECGLCPSLQECAECGQQIEEQGQTAYWSYSSGVLCEVCHQQRPVGQPISLDMLKRMQRLSELDLFQTEEQKDSREQLPDEQQLKAFHQVFLGSISRAMRKRPESLRYLKF